MAKKFLKVDLNRYHPEGREEFWNLHRPENIQVRKLLSKSVSMFSKKKKKSGRRSKELSSRGKRRVLQLASTGKYSSTEIIKQAVFNVCSKTTSNTITRAGNFQYAIKLAKPSLLAAHKMQCLSFARETTTWDDHWL